MQMLETILSERELDDEAAAEAVGVSRSQMSKLRRGKSRPSLEAAVRIQRIFGVPCEAWVDVTDSETPDGVISDPIPDTGLTSTDKAAEKIGQPVREPLAGGAA